MWELSPGELLGCRGLCREGQTDWRAQQTLPGAHAGPVPGLVLGVPTLISE